MWLLYAIFSATQINAEVMCVLRWSIGLNISIYNISVCNIANSSEFDENSSDEQMHQNSMLFLSIPKSDFRWTSDEKIVFFLFHSM